MLVLSRKSNESIVIGEGPEAVIVTVIDIRSDKVRLGIMAPEDVSVHRREVYEAILREGGKRQKKVTEPLPPLDASVDTKENPESES